MIDGYKLYWCKNDDVSPLRKKVINKRFDTLTDARAYAYDKTALSMKHHLSRTASTVIVVCYVERDGGEYVCGTVGTLGSDNDFWVAYAPFRTGKYYTLYRNGSIRKWKI